MSDLAEYNFAGRLVSRLSCGSGLMDAQTGKAIGSTELPCMIANFGKGFLAAGLQPRDRIVIGCTLSPLSSLAYLGAIYAGLVAVPVEESALISRGEIIARETRARGVWSEHAPPSDWVCAAEVVRVSGNLARLEGSLPSPAPCSGDDLAALMSTSGSTGTPRFVAVTHGNLIANTEAIIRSQHLGNDERAMLILPVSYCFGASVLHTHLYQGGSVVFDRRFMFPDKVLRAILEYRCTTFAGVPSVYSILLRRSNLKSIGMPTVRRLLQAGGPLGPQSVLEMRALLPATRFYVMYGQTEATARISCLDPAHLDARLGSVGRALDNLSVRVVGEDGHDLPSGETGEILVSGPSICSGYFNDPAESAEVFKDRCLRTRDLGCLDDEGFLWIKGRKGGFVKMAGIRVSLSEIENWVATVPGVHEAAAEVVSHAESGEAVALRIVTDVRSDEIIERIRRALPPKWICTAIHVVPALPKTSSGKLARSLIGTTRS
jgi:long-chain acyl-CoA synthetase